MDQNAPNSECFCLFCKCNAKSRYNMDFYHNSARSSWSWTSLMGPNKKKLLQHFLPTHTEEEILKFEEDAKIGLKLFASLL
ncbi:hypothetical protein C2G38_2231321 [Gigaspora rosea]|uniref:Uncharacterized protein n=1 Tax=Gigaspora rosea TaxID=44941 RepID=A0A397TWI0_9GLOM|nr:hypothetical protein C2G38_2231321 [Gigaspora rosea]